MHDVCGREKALEEMQDKLEDVVFDLLVYACSGEWLPKLDPAKRFISGDWVTLVHESTPKELDRFAGLS